VTLSVAQQAFDVVEAGEIEVLAGEAVPVRQGVAATRSRADLPSGAAVRNAALKDTQ
jgi:hypothetical protein